MKKLATFILMAGVCSQLSAQNEEDILRYSFQKLNGTPRSLGMAGAMGVVGADLSAINTNPAGLGFYRQNTYLLGLGYSIWNTKSTYIGTQTRSTQNNINIPNLGASFTTLMMDKGKQVTSGLVSYTLGFSLNRRNDFNQTVAFQGDNRSSSILDYFAQRANGIPASSLTPDVSSLEGMAWNAYLINSDSLSGFNSYVANLPDSITMRQRSQIKHSGRQQDLNASIGLNFSHRLYLGATISMNTIRYEQTSIWKEENTNFFSDTRYMTYENRFTTQGSGFSVNLGAILRITDFLRAGLNYQSGTRYSLSDVFSTSISSNNFDPGTSYNFSSSPTNFNYTLKTPAKIGGGLTFIFKQAGLISIEVENVNYSRGRLGSINYDFDTENKLAENNFNDAYNLKMGAEVLVGKLRVRGGFAHFGSPLSREVDRGINLSYNCYTTGLGYRNESGFFADFAVVLEEGTSFYTPYTLINSTRTSYTAIQTSNALRLSLSVGSTF